LTIVPSTRSLYPLPHVMFIFYSRYSHHSGRMKTTTIQVKTETKDVLKSLGKKGETFDDIIRKLIKATQYVEFMEESYQILETENNWANLDEL
jgi:predicted CopG family antitoxin